jgi:hypothetical protein
MAMNKKEQAAFAALQKELRLAKAFRLTDPVEKDVPAPQGSQKDTSGWVFNDWSMEVKPAWSSSVVHGVGYPARRKDIGASQRPISMYSTKVLALRALRRAIEGRAMRDLAEIDRQIEEDTNHGN